MTSNRALNREGWKAFAPVGPSALNPTRARLIKRVFLRLPRGVFAQIDSPPEFLGFGARGRDAPLGKRADRATLFAPIEAIVDEERLGAFLAALRGREDPDAKPVISLSQNVLPHLCAGS